VSTCRFLAFNFSDYEIKYRILKIQEVLINFLSGLKAYKICWSVTRFVQPKSAST